MTKERPTTVYTVTSEWLVARNTIWASSRNVLTCEYQMIISKVPVSEAEDKIEFLGTGLIVSIPTRFQTMRMVCLVTAKHLLRTASAANQTGFTFA